MSKINCTCRKALFFLVQHKLQRYSGPSVFSNSDAQQWSSFSQYSWERPHRFCPGRRWTTEKGKVLQQCYRNTLFSNSTWWVEYYMNPVGFINRNGTICSVQQESLSSRRLHQDADSIAVFYSLFCVCVYYFEVLNMFRKKIMTVWKRALLPRSFRNSLTD